MVDVVDGAVSHWTLPVPQVRHLVQLRTAAAGLETALKAFEPPQAEFPTWVEVIVEGAAAHEDLNQRVMAAVAGRTFEVLKVVRSGNVMPAAMRLDDDHSEDMVESLLSDPQAVFARRLALEENLDDATRAELTLTFSELWEQVSQAPPDEADAATEPPQAAPTGVRP
jgi:hypothetical protein